MWKKLADEVSPISRFLDYRKIESGRIRFPLSNEPPDCFLWIPPNKEPLTIEVTIAQGKERYFLKKELVQTGEGRGFVGVGDDQDNQQFKDAVDKERQMYESSQALIAIRDGILRCLSHKKVQSPMDILIIEAPLNILPFEYWDMIKIELREAAANLSFREIHVIGNKDDGPRGFAIKMTATT